MSVCMAVISSGSIHIGCAESIGCAIVDRAVTWVFYHQAPPYLDDARNRIVETFNREEFQECDRLLMVDADIEFTPSDIRQLEEDDLPIVGGVYHSLFNEEKLLPVVHRWVQIGDQLTLRPIEEWPDVPLGSDDWEDPLVEVPGCGAGFLMIHRQVLETLAVIHPLPCPWFAEEVRDGVHYGEDLTFCLRAADLDFKTHVDRRVEVAHHKEVRLGRNPVEGMRAIRAGDQVELVKEG